MITLRVEANWEKAKSASYVRAGKHQIVVDEPAATGGEDLGANPMQYLLSGVAGCFIGMGKIVAKEKGLQINNIRCRVECDINPDGMTGKDPSIRPGCQEIRMTIEVDSPESPDKLQDWAHTTEGRCPVRDTVAHGTTIKTTLK